MRGGARIGAGRKPGSVNKMSHDAREKAALTGELPHEFLLRVGRGETIGEHVPTFQERVDAAKAAAPYFAPKLAGASIELTTKESARTLSDEQLEAIAKGEPWKPSI